MNDFTLWELMNETWETVRRCYEPVFDNFISRNGLEYRQLGVLLAALSFEPETTTPARLQKRVPYTPAATYLTRMAIAVKQGFMLVVNPGEYRLTAKGRSELHELIKEARRLMAELDPLPLKDSRRLATLLDRLVQASLSEPAPPGNWSIRLSYPFMPVAHPPMPYTEQAISCLHAYRDDSHLAAWQPTGISPPALEALTLLWRGQADSVDSLCQRMASRDHPQQIFEEVLAELRQYSYIERDNRTLLISRSGRAFRDRIEQTTNAFFFSPWRCLEEAEKNQCAGLLEQLRDGLRNRSAS